MISRKTMRSWGRCKDQATPRPRWPLAAIARLLSVFRGKASVFCRKMSALCDAERHTKKADDPERQRMWAEIANSVLAGSEGRAIREANAAVAKDFAKSVRPSVSSAVSTLRTTLADR